MLDGVRPGTRYWYRLDGERLLPDPASRFQPEGVHGPSEVVDPAVRLDRRGWRGPSRGRARDLRAARGHLHARAAPSRRWPRGCRTCADLGVTAIELMPRRRVSRGRATGATTAWPCSPPHAATARPEALRRLVDAAHRLRPRRPPRRRLQPPRARTATTCRSSCRPTSPTGTQERRGATRVNLDGRGSRRRALVLPRERAATGSASTTSTACASTPTHALEDSGPRHFLARAGARPCASEARAAGRRVVVIAEDDRNLDRLVRPRDGGRLRPRRPCGPTTSTTSSGGLLAGDTRGLLRATTAARPRTSRPRSRRGWFYTGQHVAARRAAPRGTDPSALALAALRVLHPEPRPGGQPRARRAAEPARQPAGVPRGVGAAARRCPRRRCSSWGRSGRRAPRSSTSPTTRRAGPAGDRGAPRASSRPFAAFADPAARHAIPDPQAEATFEAQPAALDGAGA